MQIQAPDGAAPALAHPGEAGGGKHGLEPSEGIGVSGTRRIGLHDLCATRTRVVDRSCQKGAAAPTAFMAPLDIKTDDGPYGLVVKPRQRARGFQPNEFCAWR